MSDLGVKEAVSIAKQYVTDLFADDGVVSPRLEEVDYDEARSVWLVTLGFARQRDNSGLSQLLSSISRENKVVTVSGAGSVLSVKNREPRPFLAASQ